MNVAALKRAVEFVAARTDQQDTDPDVNSMRKSVREVARMRRALKALLAESVDWQDALGEGARPSLDAAIKAAQRVLS